MEETEVPVYLAGLRGTGLAFAFKSHVLSAEVSLHRIALDSGPEVG